MFRMFEVLGKMFVVERGPQTIVILAIKIYNNCKLFHVKVFRNTVLRTKFSLLKYLKWWDFHCKTFLNLWIHKGFDGAFSVRYTKILATLVIDTRPKSEYTTGLISFSSTWGWFHKHVLHCAKSFYALPWTFEKLFKA